MADGVPDAVVEKRRIASERIEAQHDRAVFGRLDRIGETRNLNLNGSDQNARHSLHTTKLPKEKVTRKARNAPPLLSGHPGKKALDNGEELDQELEFEIDELAQIIVDFYREWKQQ